jgi:hypothetical protein
MSKWIYNLTTEHAWQEFVTDTVERFISNFRSEGYTTIELACARYVKDIPALYNRPFSNNQLNHISQLLQQYIRTHIQKQGGLENLRLYTDAELEEMDAQEANETLEIIAAYKARFRP